MSRSTKGKEPLFLPEAPGEPEFEERTTPGLQHLLDKQRSLLTLEFNRRVRLKNDVQRKIHVLRAELEVEMDPEDWRRASDADILQKAKEFVKKYQSLQFRHREVLDAKAKVEACAENDRKRLRKELGEIKAKLEQTDREYRKLARGAKVVMENEIAFEAMLIKLGYGNFVNRTLAEHQL